MIKAEMCHSYLEKRNHYSGKSCSGLQVTVNGPEKSVTIQFL